MCMLAYTFPPKLYEEIEMDEQVRKGLILIKTFLFGTRQKQTQASLRGGEEKD